MRADYEAASCSFRICKHAQYLQPTVEPTNGYAEAPAMITFGLGRSTEYIRSLLIYLHCVPLSLRHLVEMEIRFVSQELRRGGAATELEHRLA